MVMPLKQPLISSVFCSKTAPTVSVSVQPGAISTNGMTPYIGYTILINSVPVLTPVSVSYEPIISFSVTFSGAILLYVAVTLPSILFLKIIESFSSTHSVT